MIALHGAEAFDSHGRGQRLLSLCLLYSFAVVTSSGLSMPAPLPPTASFEDGLPADFHFTHDFKDEEARDVMQAANAFRQSIEPPCQSDFRVLAVLVYEDVDGSLKHIVGHNCESCQIGNSLCAERCAIVQLRCRTRGAPCRLVRLYIVTDSTDAISPGMLCREFLSSLTEADFHIILGNCHSPGPEGRLFKSVWLSDLFPFPSIYRHAKRGELIATGQRFRAKCAAVDLSPEIQGVFTAALEATSRDDRDSLHPLRYAAAALLSDGTVEVAWQKKALEYSCSFNAVGQLAQAIEARVRPGANEDGGVRLLLLAYVDQFGICHAPVAAGRAYLQEYGHGDAVVLVHSERDGSLCKVKVSELAPDAPVIWQDSREHKGPTPFCQVSVAVIDWWQGELERRRVLSRAVCLHKAYMTQRDMPTSRVPTYLEARVAAGHEPPMVKVVSPQSEAQQEGEKEASASGKRKAGDAGNDAQGDEVGGEERHATLELVLQRLNEELLTELLEGFYSEG